MPFSYRNKFTVVRNLVHYVKYEKIFPVLATIKLCMQSRGSQNIKYDLNDALFC